MKRIKKFSIFCLVLSFLFVFQLAFTKNLNTVSASDEEETVLSDYAIRVGDLETTHLLGGVTLYKEKLKTLYNGVDTGVYDPNQAKYTYNHNTVQWVDLPISSQDVKVVTWSKGTTDGWASSTVRTTALDYEDKHPGWIVVAAVNGDSFDINGTKEPTKWHVQEGDVLQTNGGDTPIGWLDDNTPVVGGATFSPNMYVQIMDGSDVVDDLVINAYNTTPSETGVTLYTKDVANTYDLTGYTVYVGKYDLCRISKYTSKPFVKGEIVKVVDDLGVTKPVTLTDDNDLVREFFICSKDGSLDEFLSVGDYVRCQYPFTGDWADIQNIICGFGNAADDNAYPAQVLKDGKPLGKDSDVDFINTTHPRTVVGFKEDGSTVLFVCDGRGKLTDYEEGMSYYQLGEAMRLAGCVNAYNLDGGGSSTLLVRNSYGEFDVINRPSDGHERAIGNAILFVMRDPGISWDVKSTTRSEAVFKLNDSEYSQKLKDIKVEIDGKVAEFKDGKAIVSGLEEETTYTATITYKAPSASNENEMVNGSFQLEIKTKAFQKPGCGISFKDINKTSVTAVKSIGDYEIKNVVLDFAGFEYEMGDATTFKVTKLLSDTSYEVVIRYTIVDYETGREYQNEETRRVKTLDYSIPEILEFYIYKQTNEKLTIKYSYSDDDSKLKSAVIMCNNTPLDLTKKQGYQIISDLDLENELYELQLILTYTVSGSTEEKVESEIIKVGKGSIVTISHKINYELDGGTLPSSAATIYVEGTGLEKLPTPTKDGYKFDGWYDENDNKVTSISKTDNTDITLYAKWTESKQNGGNSCNFGSSVKYLLTVSTLLAGAILILRKRK